MCGLCGVVAYKDAPIDKDIVAEMTRALSHRGPDGNGIWYGENQRAVFGHRRLSIQDPSSAGRQPMVSRSGRYVIVFNGEVYNHLSLREQLAVQRRVEYYGHSDTETILEAFEQWGIAESLGKFVGMFAIAVLDRSNNELFLVRDRMGIKPLYYFKRNGILAFASELKSLRVHPECPSSIDKLALEKYLGLGYVPAPLTILEGVLKLEAGTMLHFRLNGDSTIMRYWDMGKVVNDGLTSKYAGTFDDAVESLNELLTDSVRLRMLSDVPIGALLSGGIDSSAVVSVMQAISDRPVHTYSIGFNDESFNEAHYAAAVAERIGTEHIEMYVNDDDAMSVIPLLPEIYDEPFADISQIPTYLVSKLARSDVKVVLSGDGGDELFGGYNRYLFVSRFWKRLGYIPKSLRSVAGKMLCAVDIAVWDKFANAGKRFLPFFPYPATPGIKMHKMGSVLALDTVAELHQAIASVWPMPDALMNGENMQRGLVLPDIPASLRDSSVMQQMYIDSVTYLPEDILTKVDRASMSVGLEARVPLLDHRIVQFAWQLPDDYRISAGEGKRVLKGVLNKYLPEAMINRPKMGFGVPIGDWLRGPLREWSEEWLSERSLGESGLFDVDVVRSIWHEHLNSGVDRSGVLWGILMFQNWLSKAR